jgi:hypothetical protein
LPKTALCFHHEDQEEALSVQRSAGRGPISRFSFPYPKLTNYSRKNRLYQAFHALGCVIRTVFLLKLLSDVKLREIVHRTTNKMEQYNAFEDWVRFGRGGTIYERAYEAQEKQLKYTSLLANCIILDNTVELSAALNTLAQAGLVPTAEHLAALSPYQTRHIKRFGNYELDLTTVPAPMTDELTFAIAPPAQAQQESEPPNIPDKQGTRG